MEIENGHYRMRVTSRAPLERFYDHVTPSLTVFHAEHPVMKTMDARLDIELYDHTDTLVEDIHLRQSILEFGGIRHCKAGQGDRSASAPRG